ncbi:twin-arginine translocase TatA/TatE family subunit [Subtercola sp. RTI3]|uniref:twin-arginine translocase TatA/TatE family subunit n=1 Tax=Subtercola sp. RTI3 TaxID=3048639 RepID=UPI002B23BF8B|nr:twin-arginine translocase TatA/TatE family subunit [Subtercola sp. RTI3]MEA9984255.1 twin-arginine translocase TatA/TatE family subunit [Subtercola sp. RTI3]
MGLLQNLNGWHGLIVLGVILLFFGAAKLPALAASVGQSARILKSEAREAADTPSAAGIDTAAGDTAPVRLDQVAR